MEFSASDSLESRRRRISSCLLIMLFVGVVCARTSPAIGQGSVQLPTRFSIDDRPPDLTVFEDLARNSAPFHRALTGDFNGDGIADLLITNSLAAGSSQAGAGRAYVILGRKSLGSPASFNLASDQPDLTILGPGELSQLGFTAAVGDLNGDGVDDILETLTAMALKT